MVGPTTVGGVGGDPVGYQALPCAGAAGLLVGGSGSCRALCFLFCFVFVFVFFGCTTWLTGS